MSYAADLPRAAGDPGAEPVTDDADRRHRWRRTVRFGVGPQWSLPQLALAGAGVAGVATFLGAMQLAAGALDGAYWLMLLPAPLVSLSWAGSGLPLAYWGALLVAWVWATPAGSFSWWSLLGAAGLAVSHSALAHGSSAPPTAGVPPESLRRWARELVLALSAALLVGATAAAIASRSQGASPAAYLIGLGGLAVGLWLLRTNPPRQPD